MEGADPIRTPDELGWWTARGLRMVGPAWQRTRYAGGTGAPGPLTPLGRDLVAAMQGEGVILDVSHLAEQSFWDAMDLAPERVCASHSNARALVPDDRHLSDAMLDALAARDAVVGLALGNALLVPADVHPADAEEADDGEEDADTAEAQDANAEDAKGTEAQAPRGWPNPRATLADARRHAAHLAGRLGWHRVGIGSDFDGGFGVQETPPALTRGADFARLARLAPPHARDDLLGGAWLRFFRRTLPA
jgi:membrane dipeptidase